MSFVPLSPGALIGASVAHDYRAWATPEQHVIELQDSRLSFEARERHVSAAQARAEHLIDQLHPVEAGRLRGRLRGQSQQELANEENVRQSAISRGLQRSLHRLRILAALPDITEDAFRALHKPWVVLSIKHPCVATDYFAGLVEQRLRVLWVYWRTSSANKTQKITGHHRNHTVRFVEALRPFATSEWSGYWQLIRDNPGFRDQKKTR